VVLLDEPFAGVDPIAVADLQERIRGLAGPGLGVLLTDHAVHETLPICDRALILVEGRVVAAGRPAEVAADPRVRARYLGPDFKLDGPIR
jgi:lipopolysaccharide export system ATP-binding protein